MKGKRILRTAAAFVLTLLLGGQALAAPGATPVRVFVYEDTLYSYMKLEDINRPITQVEAKIGNQSFPAANRLETVQQAGFPITYLLLVDNSNSMPPYQEQLVEFGKQLAEAGGENTRFIVATFGDTFQVRKENVTAQDLEKELKAIPCDETVTRLHSGIDSALDYFEALPRQGAELRAMVAVTDGVQYDPTGGVPYEELLDRIQHSDVMVHSLGFGEDSASLDSLGKLAEASDGIHQTVSEEITPKAAAEALSAAGGSLMVTGFDLTGCTASGEDTPMSFTFASGGTLLCKGTAVVDIPEKGAEESSSEAAAESSSAEETSESVPENQPSGSDSGQDSPTEPVSSVENAGGTDEAGGIALAGIAAGVIAVLAVGALLFVRRLRKKKDNFD